MKNRHFPSGFIYHNGLNRKSIYDTVKQIFPNISSKDVMMPIRDRIGSIITGFAFVVLSQLAVKLHEMVNHFTID